MVKSESMCHTIQLEEDSHHEGDQHRLQRPLPQRSENIHRENNHREPCTPAKKFTDLHALLAFLVPYNTIKQKYPRLIVQAGDETAAKAAPGQRVPEERHNVEVDCWLHYVKSETDADFHVIVGSSPNADEAAFLTVEVSGLPSGGKDLKILKQVRRQLQALISHPAPTTKYETVTPARKVRITGSLLFDGDHLPGRIGPGQAKPKTVWEIHPAISIKAQ